MLEYLLNKICKKKEGFALKFTTLVAGLAVIIAIACGFLAYTSHLDAKFYREQSQKDRASLNTLQHINLENEKLIAELREEKDASAKELAQLQASHEEAKPASGKADDATTSFVKTTMSLATLGMVKVPDAPTE